MSKGPGKTDPGKSEVSFVMTADDAERYAPPAEIDTDKKKKGPRSKRGLRPGSEARSRGDSDPSLVTQSHKEH